MNKRGKPTHVSRCNGPKRTHKQTFKSREERIRSLQESYDESGIDVNVEEMFLEAEREYAESHKKDVLS